jgi:hypothetical protein
MINWKEFEGKLLWTKEGNTLAFIGGTEVKADGS